MSPHAKRGPLAAMLTAAAALSYCFQGLDADERTGGGYLPQADPLAPITVGPREAVGKPSAGSKIVGGLLGGVLGGSGGDRGDRPRTHRDPTRKIDFVEFETMPGESAANVDPDLIVGARAGWEDDMLLVSTRVEEADDKGTFQTVFLQTCDGRRLYPQRYEIFDLWSESSLSVSWSRTSSVDGRIVSHDAGGWNDHWTEGFDGIAPTTGVPAMPATWQQLGFDRAEGGARQLGSYFNLTPETLAELGEVSLYAHTTLPGREPVTTSASYWLLRPGAGRAVNVVSDEGLSGQTSVFEAWTDRCETVSPVLLAAAGGAALTTTLDDTAASPVVRRGYPLPPGVQVSRPRGTGRTTGHIATINVRNDSDEPVVFPAMPFYIPASGQYQGYVSAPRPGTTVPPGQTVAVPIQGYCGDVRRPPVPADETLPPVDDWIVVEDPAAPIPVPPRDGAGPAGHVLIPGTDTPVPRAVDPDDEPLIAAPLLVSAIMEIERVTEGLQQEDALITPFSGDPEREREAVNQQTLWIFAGELQGEPYTEEEFTERLEAQYEQNTGMPITAAPPEDQERIQQGADDFWGAFQLVGTEAKVISHPQSTTAEPAPETQDDDPPPPEELPPPACKIDYTDEHAPRNVHVIVSDSYGNEDDRTKIRDGIRKAVEENQEAYATSTPPSTAYSLWGHDHVGGYSSAYAKSIFLEDHRQEFVWWTDPLTTSARGSSTHTMTAVHGDDCSSVIAGAALKWMKSSSEAFDPLERSIEFFRALDAVKEITVKYLADKLPPGLDWALEEGVEAITDPSSDTYAGASGEATLTVGGDTDDGESANRVVYKREDKEDKAIIGGGATVKKLFASDARAGSLTSKLEARAELTAGAQGNGFAKAYLESLYGTILIGVCECPQGIVFDVRTDSGLFIKSDVAGGVAKVARQEMQKIADEISEDIASGEQDIDADSLETRAADELRGWGEARGADRFQAVDGRDPGE